MIVFFDGLTFALQRRGGISRLFYELVRAVARQKRIEQVLYRGPYIDEYRFDKRSFLHDYGCRRPMRRGYPALRAADTWIMNLVYDRYAATRPIFHTSYYRLPKRWHGPVVTHVYDMIHEVVGPTNHRDDVAARKRVAILQSDAVISISKATSAALLDIYPQVESKLHTIYPCVSDTFFATTGDARTNTGRPCLLYVGNRSSYKNGITFLRAFRTRKLYHDFDIVLCGGRSSLSPEERAELSRVPSARYSVHMREYDDQELASLYRHATALVWTSEVEGFGIPLVEAMASGCPCVVAEAGYAREILAGDAFYFPAKDPDALASRVVEIATSPQAARLVTARARQRAEGFTAARMADETVTVYESLGAGA